MIKTYPKPKSRMQSLEDIADELALQAKVVFTLQRSMSIYTIPQLAKKLNENEKNIANALYSCCLVSLPRVLVLDEGEQYFKKTVELANVSQLPEFTSETRFYHIWAR